MAKKQEPADIAGVAVVMSCFLSGHPDNPGPGDKVLLDADEAARLIKIGAAVPAPDTAEPVPDAES